MTVRTNGVSIVQLLNDIVRLKTVAPKFNGALRILSAVPLSICVLLQATISKGCCTPPVERRIVFPSQMVRAGTGRLPLTAIATVVFMVTTSYASVCSAMCTAGICPSELPHSSDPDGCDSMPMGQSGSPENRGGHHPDCSTHHHCNSNMVKADNALQPRLASAGRRARNNAPSQRAHVVAFSRTAFFLCGLAPPPTLGSSLYTRISVLRI
jgi:hypothetical protein